jgi:hypothetical protein
MPWCPKCGSEYGRPRPWRWYSQALMAAILALANASIAALTLLTFLVLLDYSMPYRVMLGIAGALTTGVYVVTALYLGYAMGKRLEPTCTMIGWLIGFVPVWLFLFHPSTVQSWSDPPRMLAVNTVIAFTAVALAVGTAATILGSMYRRRREAGQCPVCSSGLAGQTPPLDARTWPEARLGLLPQVLWVVAELPLVALVTVLALSAAMIVTVILPLICFVSVPEMVMFAPALVFALSYRFQARFTPLGLMAGWIVAGALLFLLLFNWEGRSDAASATIVCRNAVTFLIVLPSLGAVASVCGMKYRTNPCWKYIALPGAWLVLMTYAYALYDWYVYCGRL